MSRRRNRIAERQPPGLIGVEPLLAGTPLTTQRMNETAEAHTDPQFTATGGDVLAAGLKAPMAEAEPVTVFSALGFGLLKDGRHVAFEAEVEGRAVKSWTPLCAMAIAAGPARAWWQMGFALLCQRRELLPAEHEANLRDGQGIEVAAFSDGAAVAIVGEGRKLTGLAMRLDGATVAEPGIIARGSREYCWSELASWAALNMLPKRRTT